MKKRHAENGHHMQGKHHTEEAKASMSAKLKGKPRSKESVDKGAASRKKLSEIQELLLIGAYQAGKTWKEIKKQFGVGYGIIKRTLKNHNIPLTGNYSKWKGKTHSEETKKQMVSSAKKCWNDRKNKTE